MGLIKNATTWSTDNQLDYLSVNPTRDEVTHYKVDSLVESDDSITKLNTLKNFTNITCLDYSHSQVGQVGVGEKDGYVKIVDVFANETNLTVRPKQRRCINTIGINNVGLVAMGLDKHRQDTSLQVWDINYQKQGEDLVNLSFEYFVNESIVSLQFLNDISLLVASTKFLKEIDLRVKTPVYQHPSRLSYDIKLNPFNSWQFSTYGDDGTLAIWDRRKLSGRMVPGDLNLATPLLTFDKLVGAGAASKKYMNSCFRWSSTQNREFSTLHRGDIIKRWRLGSTSEVNEQGMAMESLFVSIVHDIPTIYDRVATFDYIAKNNHGASLICMRQSGTVYRMPITQCYSNTTFSFNNSLLLSNCETPIIDELVVTEDIQKSGALQNISTEMRVLSFEDLGINDDYAPDEYNGFSEDEKSEDDVDTTDRESNGSLDHYNHDKESHNLLEDEHFNLFWRPERLLQKDISVIMKIRAMAGYGLDPMKTVDLIDQSKSLQNNAYIRNTWRWLAIAKASVDDGTMVSGDLDLGYEGIIGIWSGLKGLVNQNRYLKDGSLTDVQLKKEMEKIIRLRKKNKVILKNVGSMPNFPNSPKHIQRKLCMIISGWDLSQSDYEEKYKIIMDNGHYQKAAAWAVFFGDIPKAVEILGSSKSERLRLIATAIAGYMAYKDQPGNNSWREQCRKMASELDDPYLRVIFAFIADNDWYDVLYEQAISLRERLGVALRFLNDTDLTTFLQKTSSSVIANGELEGLILTGITPNGIDLLQSYVNKTSDVQTAALISLFGSPRYFKDERVDEWIQSYRQMLNSWELFPMRAKFDILRTKLSTTSSGKIKTKVKARQLYIQCINCKKNINNPIKERNGYTSKSLISASKRKINTIQDQNGRQKEQHRYSCPHCGTLFPRCAICLMPLGTSNLPFIINGVEKQRDLEYEIKSEKNAHFGSGQNSVLNDSMAADLELRNKKKMRLNEWFSFCLTCNHGMHAGHAEEWFARHNICPTAGCNCQCNKY